MKTNLGIVSDDGRKDFLEPNESRRLEELCTTGTFLARKYNRLEENQKKFFRYPVDDEMRRIRIIMNRYGKAHEKFPYFNAGFEMKKDFFYYVVEDEQGYKLFSKKA